MKKMISLFLVILLVAGAMVLLKKRKRDLANEAKPAALPVVVDMVTLTSGQATLTLPAMGTVASDDSALLSTKVSGRVTAVLKQEGNAVKRGDVLARIDVTDLEAKKAGLSSQRQGTAFQIDAKRAEVKALETSLKSLEETHRRTKELLDIKGASIEQYHQEEVEVAKVRANLSAALNGIETLLKSVETQNASVRELESLMDYATVVSPADGTVSQILARPGDLATPGKPLVRITSKSGLYLNVSLPGTVNAREVILMDQVLPLTSKNQAGESGLVQYVAPLLPDSGLVEGEFVNLRVVIYRAEDVILPVDALLTMDGTSSIFVLDPEGNAKRLPIRVNARGAEGVTAVENLAGLTVIVAKPDILLRVATGAPIVRHGA